MTNLNKYIADVQDIGDPLRGIGPLGLEGTTADNAPETFTSLISSTIGMMTIVAIIWFVFSFITGAYGFMTAGGDKQALESARKKIVSSITGMVMVIAAVFIIDLIGAIIGVDNILDLPTFINNLTPGGAVGP